MVKFIKLVEFKIVEDGVVDFHITAFDNMADIIKFIKENKTDNVEIYPTDILSGYVDAELFNDDEKFFDCDWKKLFTQWFYNRH